MDQYDDKNAETYATDLISYNIIGAFNSLEKAREYRLKYVLEQNMSTFDCIPSHYIDNYCHPEENDATFLQNINIKEGTEKYQEKLENFRALYKKYMISELQATQGPLKGNNGETYYIKTMQINDLC